MKCYHIPSVLFCGTCGSLMLIQRMQAGTNYVRVTCLATHCAERNVPYAFYPPETELSALPVEQPTA